MSRQNRINVTPLALVFIKKGMLAAQGVIGPASSVRLNSQIPRGKAGVTVNTKLVLMATGAELGIGARCNWMRNMKLGTVDIDHVITELSHLIGKACLVAFHAV